MNDASAAGRSAGRLVVFDGVSSRPLDEFAVDHWGRAPLLSRAAELSGAIADLFDAAAVDELVSRRGLRTPFIRMAKDGVVLPADRFTRGGGAGASIGDQVADDKVLALLDDGATLVLQALHRTWPPLVEFGAKLAAELGHPVQINAYITPPQNQGFAPHYDVHDVFVLQIAGRKHWRIHEPVLVDPLPEQNWERVRADVAARAAEAPVIDAVLEPGDALYLPRGYLHSAAALGDTTIHLTVGVHPITRQHLVRQLLTATQDDPALRAALPVATDLSDPSVIAPLLADTVSALIRQLDTVSASAVATAIGTELGKQTRPEPLAPLSSLAVAASLRPDTQLRARVGLRARVTTVDDQARIALPDKVITVPVSAESALKTILDSAAVFTPAELPGLAPDEQLVLAGRLLREGLLVPAS